MTSIRPLVALGIAAAAAFGLHAVATAPAPTVRSETGGLRPASQTTTVTTCDDPGRSWCGGDTFAIDVYAPDGDYRDDGSIPLTTNIHTR